MKKGLLVFVLIFTLFFAFSASALALSSAGALADALNDLVADSATANGNTVTLEDDINLDYDSLIIDGGTIILDLNGYTLSGDNYDGLIVVEDGRLTIQDSKNGGTIQNTGYGDTLVVRGGRLTLNSGNIQSMGDDGIQIEAGSLYVKGGHIEADDDGVYVSPYESGDISAIEFSGSFRIAGEYHAIYGGDADLYFHDITDMTLSGVSAGIMLWDGNIIFENVSGGRIHGADGAAVEVWNESSSIAISLVHSPVQEGGEPRVAMVEGYFCSFTTADKLTMNNASRTVVFGDFAWDDEDFLQYLQGIDEQVKKDHPYISGYPDGSFRVDGLINRAEAATMMARAIGKNDKGNTTGQFSDVPLTHWANANIAVLSAEGIITGYGDGTYLPAKNITRAEFVTMVCRLMGKGAGFVNNGYADVAGHWAAGYIYTAQGEGWLADFAGTNFNPDKAITRGEAVQILNRALGRDKMTFVTKVADFTDVLSTHPLYDAIMRAASEMR